MKIVIAGAGEVGTHLAKMLSKENQDITLLDSDQSRLDVIDSNYNLMTWNGSTSSFESLKDVGVGDADPLHSGNALRDTQHHKLRDREETGSVKTVARIDNCEFLVPENKQVLRELGVDFLIYPENLAANEIAMALDHNWTRYWGALHDGKLLMIGVKLHGNSVLLDKKLRDLPVTNHNFHIAAIKRNNETIIPNGNDEILTDDIVYFITTPEHKDEVMKLCGKTKRVIRKAFIMGDPGSPDVSPNCTMTVSTSRFSIRTWPIARAMATQLPDCEIVFGDGRDIEVLRENNIYQYDAFLALSDSSETNILACMTAKEFGVPKTIADVENLQFYGLAENLNIGMALNKKLLASSRIYQILIDADDSSRFLAMADAEVAEIYVKDGAKITKGPVRTLKLPFGMTLAAMVRGEHVMLVDGNTQIMAGDYVVVFSLMGTIQKLDKWFN